MKMKGQILAVIGSWFWIFVIALIVLGVLFAVFYFNLIPGAKNWLLNLLGVK